MKTQYEIDYVKANYGKITGRQIAQNLSRHTTWVERLARNLQLKSTLQNYKHNSNLDLIKSMTSPEIIYMLGYLWADGHLGFDKGRPSKLVLSIVSKDFANIKEIIKKMGNAKIYIGQRKHWQETATWILSDRKLGDFLYSLDFHQKSHVNPSKLFKLIPEYLKSYWWLGYFDGDGCLTIRNKQPRSLTLAGQYNYNWEFLAEELKNNQIYFKSHNRISERGKSSTFYPQSIKELMKFLHYIYKNTGDLGLIRKRIKYTKVKDYTPHQNKNNYKYIYYLPKSQKWTAYKKSYPRFLKCFNSEKEALAFRDNQLLTTDIQNLAKAS